MVNSLRNGGGHQQDLIDSINTINTNTTNSTDSPSATTSNQQNNQDNTSSTPPSASLAYHNENHPLTNLNNLLPTTSNLSTLLSSSSPNIRENNIMSAEVTTHQQTANVSRPSITDRRPNIDTDQRHQAMTNRFQELAAGLRHHRGSHNDQDICLQQLADIEHASPGQQRTRLDKFGKHLHRCPDKDRIALTEMLAILMTSLKKTKKLALGTMEPVLTHTNRRGQPALRQIFRQMDQIHHPGTQHTIIKMLKKFWGMPP